MSPMQLNRACACKGRGTCYLPQAPGRDTQRRCVRDCACGELHTVCSLAERLCYSLHNIAWLYSPAAAWKMTDNVVRKRSVYHIYQFSSESTLDISLNPESTSNVSSWKDTSLGSLLVHDPVAAFSAPDRVSGLDLVFSMTFWFERAHLRSQIHNVTQYKSNTTEVSNWMHWLITSTYVDHGLLFRWLCIFLSIHDSRLV